MKTMTPEQQRAFEKYIKYLEEWFGQPWDEWPDDDDGLPDDAPEWYKEELKEEYDARCNHPDEEFRKGKLGNKNLTACMACLMEDSYYVELLNKEKLTR